jgi:hypothetical protein
MYYSADKGANISPAPDKDNEIKDVRVEADTTSNGKSGGWGVSCRYDPNGSSAYLRGITDEGLPLIVKEVGGKSTLITKGKAKDVANPASNHRVRGDCVRNNLALYVDASKLIEGSDNELSAGRIGLFVDHVQDVLFDDFSASNPKSLSIGDTENRDKERGAHHRHGKVG